jgi:hypothetical protein
MDDIFFPDETEDMGADVEFEKAVIAQPKDGHPSGIDASDYVKITFGRFVELVANHSFEEVVERNQDEDVIMTTNLLTDLANSRRFSPNAKGPIMVLGGLLLGVLIGYFIF